MLPTEDHGSNAVRLLIIDGEPTRHAFAGEVCRYLVVRPEIMTVLAGRPALETLRRTLFDLVLVDLASIADLASLPEDGMGRLVKAAEGALIVALSDDASVSAAVAVMRAGAHDVAARPIGARELAARLARLAQRHGRERLFDGGQLIAEMAREAAGLAEASAQIEAVGRLLGWPGDLDQLRHLVQQIGGTAMGTGLALSTPPTTESAGKPSILPMWQQEQRIIEEAIAAFSGNIALAAAALELSPSTIYRKRQAWAAMEQTGAA